MKTEKTVVAKEIIDLFKYAELCSKESIKGGSRTAWTLGRWVTREDEMNISDTTHHARLSLDLK